MGKFASTDGPRSKLARAQSQLESLQLEVERAYPRSYRWPVRTEIHRGGLEYRFHVNSQSLPPVDEDWGLRAGEIMFDLRSALDHLMFQLWERHYRGNFPARIQELSEFPICGKPDKFVNHRNRIHNVCKKEGIGLGSLSDRDWLALGNLQPYVRRHDKWEWTRYWLGKLNELHNIDKHRKLHVVVASQNAAVGPPEFDPTLGFAAENHWGPVEPDGHVQTWTFAKAAPEIPPHGGALLHVTLENGEEHAELCAVILTALVAHVDKVIDKFESRF